MVNDEIKQFIIDSLPFWDKLDEQQQNRLLGTAIYTKYNKGEIIHQGDNDCIGVIIVKSGQLRTYMLSEEGKEITLFRPEPSDICILSASCVLNTITFEVHIEADQESEIAIINSFDFKAICDENIYAENFSYRITSERFSDVMWVMEQILFMSMDKRLAVFLLDEIAKTGSEEINLTHDQIAKYTGSAREVVSRMLKYFERESIVLLSRGGIKIIDKKKLRAIL